MNPTHVTKKKSALPALVIVLLAFSLRMYGINWDAGWHLHPDERMLIMVAERIEFFDQLNPDFFNYGSLPIYLLKATAEIVSMFSRIDLSNYDGMLKVGRVLSALFDSITVIAVYKISRMLFQKGSAALLSAFFYAICFFPIQNAHFFIVDPLLTMFITLTLYNLLVYVSTKSINRLFFVGLFAAGAITTKFTGILLLPIIGLGLICVAWAGKILSGRLLTFGVHSLLFGMFYLLCAFIFMPYGFIDRQQFVSEIGAQLRMNSDPFVFPYTLQYVGTTSYWYYVKNIVLWGLGPIISLLSLVGLTFFAKNTYKFFIRLLKSGLQINKQELIILLLSVFFLLHFGVIGKSAVKFMRYMLPLYPFFAILAGYGMFRIVETSRRDVSIVGYFLLASSTVWTLMFMSLYSRPHTRIEASEWIFEHIPAGSTIAVEHWDDLLPLPVDNKSYQFETLELYNPDSKEKWNTINKQLEKSDYIVIASNRLYVPLQRLTDCSKLPEHRCYPDTSEYYKNLFDHTRGFKKIAEFASYPRISLFNFKVTINDDSADESFTVYDHPKVLIFKKM